jgi:SAM-dependent methyltransferase
VATVRPVQPGPDPARKEGVADGPVEYFPRAAPVRVPGATKVAVSRICFPLLAFLSREQSLRIGLTPIDDERVIAVLRRARGRVLDVGCGSNLFVRSYGNGVGVDVVNWEGCDLVVEDVGRLPFDEASFDTVTFLACLNHIPNREAAVREAYRVLRPGGQVLLTMITPRIGTFIHWLREKHDPDHLHRRIDREHELLGMSAGHVGRILRDAGFTNVERRRFVFGLNNVFSADK